MSIDGLWPNDIRLNLPTTSTGKIEKFEITHKILWTELTDNLIVIKQPDHVPKSSTTLHSMTKHCVGTLPWKTLPVQFPETYPSLTERQLDSSFGPTDNWHWSELFPLSSSWPASFGSSRNENGIRVLSHFTNTKAKIVQFSAVGQLNNISWFMVHSHMWFIRRKLLRVLFA